MHSVPHDLALAGFNGLPLTEAMPLQVTTIKTPRFEMGVAAAELFLGRMAKCQDDSGWTRKISMPLTLLQGETT